MGGPRLLCPRPQPDRLRPRSARRWADFPTTEGGTPQAARASAPIRPPRSPRSRSASGQRSIDTNVARVVARYHGIERSLDEARNEIRQTGRSDDAGRPARRFRPGDDGPRRDDLPAQEPGLRRLPAGGRLRGPCERQPEAFPAPKREARAARTATASPGGSSATARLAGAPPGQGHARRDGGACPARSGTTSAPRHAPTLAPVTPCLHPFHARPARRRARRAGRRRLVAAARPARRSRPADALREAPSKRCLAKGQPLPPDPFFSGPGLDRADHLRADPERDRRAAVAPGRAAARLARRRCRPSTSDGRLGWAARRRAGLVPRPRRRRAALLALPEGDAAADARAAFRRCWPSSTRSEAPLFAAALSLANWHRRHRFCSNCGHEREIQPRRLVAAMRRAAAPSIIPRVDPVVIMLAEHDGRAAARPPAAISARPLFRARRVRRARRNDRGRGRARAQGGSRDRRRRRHATSPASPGRSHRR